MKNIGRCNAQRPISFDQSARAITRIALLAVAIIIKPSAPVITIAAAIFIDKIADGRASSSTDCRALDDIAAGDRASSSANSCPAEGTFTGIIICATSQRHCANASDNQRFEHDRFL